MDYRNDLRNLQIQLTTIQRHVIEHAHQVAIIFEGRDASGKDGVIKRITAHLSPRETRVVALPPPSDRDQRSWYFQRYVGHLPAAQEIVLFNRSWYNRAGVEPVMGFCSDVEYQDFLLAVPVFEKILTNSGMQLLKYYLDISREEQAKRLTDRARDPLKRWKSSPIDALAQEKWSNYSSARDKMLKTTSSRHAPWILVDANNKKSARLNIIRDILQRIECPSGKIHSEAPDTTIVRQFSPDSKFNALYP
jgi:polyphosphate kinase 2